jgi:hypothetical protein
MKIIGSIQKKDKLSKNEDSVLEIESNDFFQSFRRWYFSRGRDDTIKDIKKIINSCFEVTDQTLNNETTEGESNKPYFNEENSCLLQRFLVEMNSAGRGLNNLKDTYSNDIKVISEIEILKEQLDLRIKKINSLLKIDKSVIN